MEPSTLQITDAHTHFFSHTFFKTLLAQRPGGPPATEGDEVASLIQGLGLEPPPPDPLALAERWIKEMDRQGVRQLVLMASLPTDWPAVARAIQAHPSRFAGYAMLDPKIPDAVSVAERLLGAEGFRGLCFFPALHRFHVYDPEAVKVIEVAKRHRAVVFCHFGILRIPIRERLGVPSPFDGTYAVPTDLHRPAADFPEVVFHVPHFGAGYFRELLILGVQCPNVVVDTSSSNNWIQQVGHPLDLTAVIRKTLDVFGPERILWGSDSGVLPRGWRRDLFDEQITCFKAAGCDHRALLAIFGKNARRLLRLPEPAEL